MGFINQETSLGAPECLYKMFKMLPREHGTYQSPTRPRPTQCRWWLGCCNARNGPGTCPRLMIPGSTSPGNLTLPMGYTQNGNGEQMIAIGFWGIPYQTNPGIHWNSKLLYIIHKQCSKSVVICMKYWLVENTIPSSWMMKLPNISRIIQNKKKKHVNQPSSKRYVHNYQLYSHMLLKPKLSKTMIAIPYM